MKYRCEVEFSTRLGDVPGAQKYLNAKCADVKEYFLDWLKENTKYDAPFRAHEELYGVTIDAMNGTRTSSLYFYFYFNETPGVSAPRVIKLFIYDLMDNYKDFLTDFMASVIFDVQPIKIGNPDVMESTIKGTTSLIMDKLLAGTSIRNVITEEAKSQYDKTVYAVTGYYDTYARTLEDAKLNVRDEDFGDLYDVNYSVDYSEDTMDGYRNDQVHVTFEVTGLVDVDTLDDDEAEEILSEEDFGELEDVSWRKTFLKPQN